MRYHFRVAKVSVGSIWFAALFLRSRDHVESSRWTWLGTGGEMAGIPSTVTSTVAVVTMAPWRAVTVRLPGTPGSRNRAATGVTLTKVPAVDDHSVALRPTSLPSESKPVRKNAIWEPALEAAAGGVRASRTRIPGDTNTVAFPRTVPPASRTRTTQVPAFPGVYTPEASMVPFGSVVSHVGTNETSWPQRSFPWEKKGTFAASAVPVHVAGLMSALQRAPMYSYVTDIHLIRGDRDVFVVVGDAWTWMLPPENELRSAPGRMGTHVPVVETSNESEVPGGVVALASNRRHATRGSGGVNTMVSTQPAMEWRE